MLTPVKIKRLTLTNFKIHEHAALLLDEHSVKLKGDTETGKSTIMKAIEAFFMMRPFPSNPVTLGKEEFFGAIEFPLEGQIYKVTRRFSGKNLKGFEVYVDGKYTNLNWSDVVTKIFGGINPGQYYLDYTKLWYHNNTTEARFEYFMKCALGEVYDTNIGEIKSLKDKRREVGSKRKTFEGRLKLSAFSGHKINDLVKKYEKPQDLKKAQAEKDAALNKRVDVVALANELQQVKDKNEQATEYKDQLQRCKEIDLPELQRQLQEIQRKIEAKQKEIKTLEADVKKHPIDEKREQELTKRMQTVKEDNAKIEREADQAYNDKAKAVSEFNAERDRFQNYKTDYEEFERLNKEWDEYSDKMDKIEQDTKDLFTKRIPLKEIEIITLKQVSRRWEKVEKDEKLDEDAKTIQAIWYKGQEMALDNISTGESIRLTIKLQQTMYPNSQFRLLFLPNAQDLGGKADEFIRETMAAGYQLIVEQTVPNEKFGWEIIDDEVPEVVESEVTEKLPAKKKKAPVQKETAKKVAGSGADKKVKKK